jgi:hypothetical protein
MVRLRELAAVDVLKAYRQQGERLRDEELQKAQRLLANGGNAEDVLDATGPWPDQQTAACAQRAVEKFLPKAASMRWPWPRNSLPSVRAHRIAFRIKNRNESVTAQ